jgi:hypothetical protein
MAEAARAAREGDLKAAIDGLASVDTYLLDDYAGFVAGGHYAFRSLGGAVAAYNEFSGRDQEWREREFRREVECVTQMVAKKADELEELGAPTQVVSIYRDHFPLIAQWVANSAI